MITINFTGGVRKSFDTDKIVLDKDNITVNQLIEYLIGSKPKNTASFDGKNLLIAINEIDSSALDGYDTVIKQNDVVNIIPVIHGGSQQRIKFKISNQSIELFEFRKNKHIQKNFLDDLRTEFPNLVIQAISSNFILNRDYVKKILSLSIFAKKHDILLSKKLEIDILLRFACTTQINEAIKNHGIKKDQNFLMIVIGKNIHLNKLFQKILPNLINPFSNNNSVIIKNHFNISKESINTINSKTPLEDLLVEKASILT